MTLSNQQQMQCSLLEKEEGKGLSDGASKGVKEEYIKTRKVSRHETWPG